MKSELHSPVISTARLSVCTGDGVLRSDDEEEAARRMEVRGADDIHDGVGCGWLGHTCRRQWTMWRSDCLRERVRGTGWFGDVAALSLSLLLSLCSLPSPSCSPSRSGDPLIPAGVSFLVD